ncbi:MAG: hypothetical protein U0103_14290 [Candidatus Obscuribacterales bacterium]
MKLDASEQKVESSTVTAITHSLVSLDDFKGASRKNSTKPEPVPEVISFNDSNDPYKDTKHSALTEYVLKRSETAPEEEKNGHHKFENACIRVEHGRAVFVEKKEPLEETKTAQEFELAMKLRSYEIQCPRPRVYD